MQVPLDLLLPFQIAAGPAGLGLLLFRAVPLLAMTLHDLT